ncbi:monoacylglycerol lipase-like [Telopea speciosissima]|uniref:monoacylglycerol lipase-like n=1 Tax=Telopea speciosissima TaxID=54955 RepID=UPI001CC53A8D|nr:monoacylglycerol lipase-like [Telopea speciosissima]
MLKPNISTVAVKELEAFDFFTNRFHYEESAKKLSVDNKSIKEVELSIVSWKRFFGKETSKKYFLAKKNFEVRLSHLLRRKLMAIEVTGKMTDASPSLLVTSGASGRVNALLSLRLLKSLVMLINAFVMFTLLPFRGRRRCVTALADKSSKDEKQESSSVRKTTVLRVPAAMVTRRSNLGATGEQEVVARRALAIKGATMDKDSSTVREVFLFVTSRGETLFTQTWTPVSVNIKGVAIILHGLNEHSGRYSDFAKQLNVNGFKVYGMDWIGHGGSDGLHGYVHSLCYAVSDMKAFVEMVTAENPGLPCFCFGHSTGAAIVLKALLDPKIEAVIEGVVLTSPALRVQTSHPIFGMLAPIFSFLLPKYQFSAANKKGMPVSRDPEALLVKYSDPLVYTGSIRIRTGSEILRITTYLQQNLRRISVPFLVLHGTADTVTDPEASQKLYEEASSTDKSIKLYEGFLHDLLFEPEREDIVKHIIDWLNSRVKV